MKFHGVIAAMVTPYAEKNFTISSERIKILCDFLISKGVYGILPLGTTGEGPYLSKEARKQVAEAVVKHINKRIPVIIHTGALSTADTVELSLHAQKLGADAIAVMTPFFRHLEDKALFDFFVTVAREVAPFPMFVYNIPSNTNNDISPELLFRLATHTDNIVGIKYSSNDLIRFREYRRKMGEDFLLFIGSDEMILPALFEGANGCVSGPASAYPEVIAGIYNAFIKKDFQEAARQQGLLDDLREIFKDGTLLCYFKAILQLRGIETGQVKPPLRNITPEELEVLERDLRGLQLL